MNKSLFILNDVSLEIKSICFNDKELSIKTKNNYMLNIDLKFDITKLNDGVRENISKKIDRDQNFVTEKYSYVIDLCDDIYLTKNKDGYLLEINIPKVTILIPPFDNINNKRLESDFNYDELEIHKLEVKIYFNCYN